MIVIVCGGRFFTNRRAALEALTAAHQLLGFTHIVEGGQRTWDHDPDSPTCGQIIGGGDYWGWFFARANGLRVSTERADWTRWGKAAGPIRNQRMLDLYQPHGVVALPGLTGTQDMIDRAYAAGKHVFKIGPWPETLAA